MTYDKKKVETLAKETVKSTKKTIKEKEAELVAKKDVKKQEVERFSTGCDILDCIYSEGRKSTQIGFPVGKVYYIHSASMAGKTRKALEAFYSIMAHFGKENVDYLFLDGESGLSIDTMSQYGFPLEEGKTLKKIKSVEQCQVEVHNFSHKKKKKYGIIIVDSMDSLGTAATIANLETRKKQHDKGKEIEAIKSYNMDKPKLLSEILPIMVSECEKTSTFVILVQQERDNVGASMFEEKTRVSGGKAIKYYSTLGDKIKRVHTFGAKDRETGFIMEVLAEKTRTKYERRVAYIVVDHELGIDNIKSNLIFLYDLFRETKNAEGKPTGKKFDIVKAQTLKWYDEWNPLSALEEVKVVSTEQYKEFVEKHELAESIRETIGKCTENNIKKYISSTPEVKKMFVDEHNVMDIDTLCAWIEDNALEGELRRRVIDKFYTIEEGLRPVKRRSRRLA